MGLFGFGIFFTRGDAGQGLSDVVVPWALCMGRTD